MAILHLGTESDIGKFIEMILKKEREKEITIT